MIPKSGHRFSEKIMLKKQQAKAKSRFNRFPYRFSAARGVTPARRAGSLLARLRRLSARFRASIF
jgi:hypothetical protein